MGNVSGFVNSNVFSSFKSSNLVKSAVENKTTEKVENKEVEKKETNTGVQNNNPQQVQTSKKEKIKKALPYVATGLSAAAVVTTGIVLAKTNRNTKSLENSIKTLEERLSTLNQTITTTAQPKDTAKNVTSFVLGLLGAGTGAAAASEIDKHKKNLSDIGINDEDIEGYKKNISETYTTRENSIKDANDAKNASLEALGVVRQHSDKVGTTMSLHTKNYNGLNLLILDRDSKYVNKNITGAIDNIQHAVTSRTSEKPGDVEKRIAAYKEKYIPLMASNSTWSITAEYDPIKAGGLGSVPMEIHNNFADMGVDNPVFIPMYQFKGTSEFLEYTDKDNNKKYQYTYGKNKFNLSKMAEMTVPQFRNGKVRNENVEFYLGYIERKDIDGKNVENKDQPIVFIKNTDNFSGDIYANGTNSDEKEKFAFMSKAVYQLAEAKVSEALGENKTGLGELKIINKEAYDAINPPVGMILNDWHAAPVAGLLRYKAPMENAYGGISNKVKDALKDMPLEMIGHNAGIPGESRTMNNERSDAITENIINTLYDNYAYGITENAHTGREPESVCNAVLWEKNDSNNRQFNCLAHGIALSDTFVPVSRNYDKELKENIQNSGLALDIITAKKDTGSMRGEVNGLDRATSSTEAKAEWLKNSFGMDIQVYNQHSSIDTIMDARHHNKMELYDHYIKPIQDGQTTVGGKQLSTFGEASNISREDFEKAPMIAFAHRLTEQKGLELFQSAVVDLFNTWDEKHPGQPKPFIFAGGELEDSNQKQYMDGLKNPDNYNDKNDVNRILAVKGFTPNPALMAGTTYFCAPSTFEPCGLTQGECYAMATPIITTATGGFVDTIQDGVNGFVAPYTSLHQAVDIKHQSKDNWRKENSASLKNKFDEAMDTYFNNPDKYKGIVEHNMHEDLSWNRNSEDDPIHGHMKRLGINNDNTYKANIAKFQKNLVKTLKNIDAEEKNIHKVNNDNSLSSDERNEKLQKANNKIQKLRVSQYNVLEDYSEKLKNSINNSNNIGSNINDKIKLFENNKTISDRKDIYENKIDALNLKKNMLDNKQGLIERTQNTLENDRKMFDLLFAENNNDDVKHWKEDLYKRYSV